MGGKGDLLGIEQEIETIILPNGTCMNQNLFGRMGRIKFSGLL